MWIVVIVTLWFLIMSVLDVKSRRVPVWLLGLGSGVITVIAVYRCESGMREYSALFGGAVPGILLLVLALFTRLVGYGDGIVLAAVGMLVGLEESVLILSLGLMLAAVCSVVLLVLGKAGRKTQIPFLPFLAVAWILMEVIQ